MQDKAHHHWVDAGRRWLLAGIALLALMLGASGAQAREPMPALVFDLDTGEVLLAHDAGQPWYPASLTKLMTAYLVMEAVNSGRLSFTDEAVISKAAAYGVERGAAKYGAKPGERMSLDRMLTFLMVRSDADMALALAEAVAGDVPSFVARMNAAAARLGMTATHFVNPHGMHDDAQRTTARDMALLARAIYTRFLRRHPDWWRFFSLRQVEKTVRLKNGKTAQAKLKNRNYLLFMMPEANGMKTGFLCSSGFNLLGTAQRGGVRLGAVVFGRRSAYNRAVATRILLEEGFRRRQASEGLRIPVSRLRNGATHAPDMRQSICNTRILPQVDRRNLAGWTVILGPFRNRLRATGVVEAELLAADLMDEEGIAYGVVPIRRALLQRLGLLDQARRLMGRRLKRRTPAVGMIWRLREAQALELCRRARLHGTGCTVQNPQDVMALATLLPATPGQRRTARAPAPLPRKRPPQLKTPARPEKQASRSSYRMKVVPVAGNHAMR